MSTNADKKYCPYCGHELPPGEVWYCPYCGSSLKDYFKLGQPTAGATSNTPAVARRPIGIALISIFGFLLGLFFLLMSFSLFVLRVIVTPSMMQQIDSQMLSAYGITLTYSEVEDYALYMGVLAFGFALVFLLSGYGLWKMKRWGWLLALVVSSLMALVSALDFVLLLSPVFLLPLLVDLAVLVYLARSKKFFARPNSGPQRSS